MRKFTEDSLDRDGSYVTCRCRNHEQKRWFMKDPRGAGSRISQNIGLHYEGDLETQMPACPFQQPRDAEYVALMEEAGMSHECLCDFKDLEWWDGAKWVAV